MNLYQFKGITVISDRFLSSRVVKLFQYTSKNMIVNDCRFLSAPVTKTFVFEFCLSESFIGVSPEIQDISL